LLTQYYNNFVFSLLEDERKKIEKCSDGKFRNFPIQLEILRNESIKKFSEMKVASWIRQLLIASGSYKWMGRELTLRRRREIEKRSVSILNNFSEKEFMEYLVNLLPNGSNND